MLKDSVPSEHDNEREKETSPEESALQELERVTAKVIYVGIKSMRIGLL